MTEKLHPPFNTEAVISAFSNLAEAIKPFLHNYNVIIGDDVSGRLPTLVIANLAGKRRRQMGLSNPSVFFINAGASITLAGRPEITLPKIAGIISQHRSPNQNILIVTEFVGTGASLAALANEFRRQGIIPDLCVLNSHNDPALIDSLKGYRIYCGSSKNNVGSLFYKNTALTGVKSPFTSSIAARLLLTPDGRAQVIQAREDMKTIANEVWEKIFSDSNHP